jgi:predicted MFS family arabinose efflux permease
MVAVAYPMTDAVYSDLIVRLGAKREHLIGLCDSSINLAYVIGPVTAGYIAYAVGEKLTFAVIGGLTVAVSLFLLMVTPKKLKLPESEISRWQD